MMQMINMDNIADVSAEIAQLEKLIKTRQARLAELKQKNEEATEELATIDFKLNVVSTNKSPVWKTMKHSLSASASKLDATNKKLVNKQSYTRAQKCFLERIGLSMGFNEEQEGVEMKSIIFDGISENESYKLFFTELILPTSFKVTISLPYFEEFEALAEEVNESKNFVYLIWKAREYFVRYAEAEGKS